MDFNAKGSSVIYPQNHHTELIIDHNLLRFPYATNCQPLPYQKKKNHGHTKLFN